MSAEGKRVKFTILHTNDLHGDFLPHEENGRMIGGLSRLSGYVKKVREEEENVLYFNAGDMFNGSVIDSEYRGLVTAFLLNNMTIDCATIGNHEVDYGVPHMVFVDRCTDFPIVNCNLYVPLLHKKLFEPYIILEKAGIRILLSGYLTESAINQTKNDELISAMLEIDDPMTALGKYYTIGDDYSNDNVADMYIILSHIGYDEDLKFAKDMNDNRLYPDLIVGGHSHTLPEDIVFVGRTGIVQAGTGSGHIGRLDAWFNTETRQLEDCRWQCIEINEETAPNDPIIDEILGYFKSETDKKYNSVFTILNKELRHPFRFEETELGNFFCDLLKDASGADIVFLGSGTIRGNLLPKLVTKEQFMVVMPYENELQVVKLTGAQIRAIWDTILGKVSKFENVPFLQVSKGFEVDYDWHKREITKLRLDGEDIEDDKLYSVCMQKYSVDSINRYNINIEDVRANGRILTVAVSDRNFLEQEMSNENTPKSAEVEGRITFTPTLVFPESIRKVD